MTVSTPSFTPGYSFDNNDPEAADRHNILPAMLDPFTTARLASIGPLAGKRCLELGAGGGSIAAWLAGQVGPTGRVLATDVNTKHLPTDGGFEVLAHDLVDEPVPDGPWDLIHARLLLLHLPERREVLRKLAASLAPGGAIALEEFATTLRGGVLAAPSAHAAELYEEYQTVLVEKILPAKGNDPTWAQKAHAAMLEEGLVDVETVAHADSWPGGTAGARLTAVNIAQLRGEFIAAGMPAERLDELCRLVNTEPALVLRGHITYSIIGRRAAG